MLHMLNHRAQYVIYAPYIQRIINYTTEMEFGYDGKHEAYQPHIVRAPTVPPPSSSVVAHDSPPASARTPPASRHAPLATPESSRAATHWGKKQNILIKGLKNLISMCHSNDGPIHESHQQMRMRLSHLEECQHEMHISMGLRTPEPTIYPPLPPPTMEDPLARYRNAGDEDEDDDEAKDEIEEESE
jgi:hypothetical protein